MHLHNRKPVLGISLMLAFVLSLCPVALAAPFQSEVSSPNGATVALIETCREQVDVVNAEIEAERAAAEAAAIEAAKPESVRRAEACLGVPYRSGASSPGGFDCSGLVRAMRLPETTGTHTRPTRSGACLRWMIRSLAMSWPAVPVTVVSILAMA